MNILHSPKENTKFSIINQRLALLQSSDIQFNYWNSYWNNTNRLHKMIKSGRKGDLGEYARFIKQYIDKSKPILEAGCGPGHLVAALSANGYRAIGVDNEVMVVNYAKANLPEENISIGDVTKVDLPNEYLGAYLSFGVVEHFILGPEPILDEAYRLLENDGIALISVPFLNPSRKKLQKYLSTQNEIKNIDNYKFHQYYYSIEDFQSILNESGFNLLEWYPYAVQAFLTREHLKFRNFWHSPITRYKIQKLILAWLEISPLIIRRRYGHMVLFVCQKKPINR